MPDRPWKQEEREVARLLSGSRYPANPGERVDVEGSQVVAQVKLVKRLSLPHLEASRWKCRRWGEGGKVGLLVVKRWAGRGRAPLA